MSMIPHRRRPHYTELRCCQKLYSKESSHRTSYIESTWQGAFRDFVSYKSQLNIQKPTNYSFFKNLSNAIFYHFYFLSLTIFSYLTQKMSIKKKKYLIHSSTLIPLQLEIIWAQPTLMTSISLMTLKTPAIVSFLHFCLSLLPLSVFHLKTESELGFSVSGKWSERL